LVCADSSNWRRFVGRKNLQETTSHTTIPYNGLKNIVSLNSFGSHKATQRQKYGTVKDQFQWESVGVLMQVRPENQPPEQQSEQTLISRVQSGDFSAVEELYGRYSRLENP
jgi:hypothetical protein